VAGATVGDGPIPGRQGSDDGPFPNHGSPWRVDQHVAAIVRPVVPALVSVVASSIHNLDLVLPWQGADHVAGPVVALNDAGLGHSRLRFIHATGACSDRAQGGDHP